MSISPERWRAEALLRGEQAVWNGLGTYLDGELVESHLHARLDRHEKSASTSWVERYGDFLEAKDRLRKALHAGDVVGEFLDEHGNSHAISRVFWGSDAGGSALGAGWAWFDASLTTEAGRLVLIKRGQIESLISNTLSEGAGSDVKTTGAAAWRVWLGEQMRAGPDHRPMARGEFYKKVKRDFGIPSLSKREFERHWGVLTTEIAPGWKKAGRSKTPS